MEKKSKKKGFSFYFFKPKPIELGSRYDRWRGIADLLGLNPQERQDRMGVCMVLPKIYPCNSLRLLPKRLINGKTIGYLNVIFR